MHTRAFSINIQAHVYAHAFIIIRNVHACNHMIFCAQRTVRACAHTIFHARGAHVRTYAIFHVRASTGILACNSACLCVHAQASAGILAHAPVSIRSHGGCSLCLNDVLSNTLLKGEIGHSSRTAHVYIRGDFGDYLYHSPEYPEHCSLQWLGEEICIHLSCQAVFHGEVSVINIIFYKEVSQSDVLFLLHA